MVGARYRRPVIDRVQRLEAVPDRGHRGRRCRWRRRLDGSGGPDRAWETAG
jgi:hypothetical protein